MQLELNDHFRGKCLIAMPNLRDSIFDQSVVYITEHNTIGGAVGVIINRDFNRKEDNPLLNFNFADYTQDWSKVPLHLGGPVKTDSGFVLYHNVDSKQLQLTGIHATLKQITQETFIEPLMLTAGYCMWDTLQLEHEVRANNWLVIDNIAAQLINDVDPTDRYQFALRKAGVTSLATFDFSGSGHA